MPDNSIIEKTVAQAIAADVIQGKIPDTKAIAAKVGMKNININKGTAYQRALFEELPYEWLATKQKESLVAWRLQNIFLDGELKEDEIIQVLKPHNIEFVAKIRYFEQWKCLVKVPDWEHRDKALDKIYKIFGLYAAEKHALVRPLEDLSDDELLKIVNEGRSRDIGLIEAKMIENEDF